MALFQLPSFKLTKQELDSYGVTMYDEADQANDMTYYVTKTPVKLVPTEIFPSFYMVNRYGEVYSDTQYKLVAYLRMMVADPTTLYETNNDGMTYKHYEKNPFHPYWIGGVDVGNQAVNTGNPNRKNVVRNSSQLFDIIRYGGIGTAVSSTKVATYGIRNTNTKVIKLGGIGEDLIPDSGGLPFGMFIPSATKWLVFDTDLNNIKGAFYATQEYPAYINGSNYADYSLVYLTPTESTSATSPYMLPNLFVDHFSYYNKFPKITTIEAPFDKTQDRNSAIAILTYGVEPV